MDAQPYLLRFILIMTNWFCINFQINIRYEALTYNNKVDWLVLV